MTALSIFSAFAEIPTALKNARWIWPTYATEIVNTYAAFRKSFKLDAVPKTAPLYITADQKYMLFVNGKFVCSGPARGFQDTWPYDKIDIADFLKEGKNTIAVRVYCVGRDTFQYATRGVAGLIFALDIDGNSVLSDKTVKCRIQNGCDRWTAQYSMQMDNQEHIDLRVEPLDWITPDFDDSSWGVNRYQGDGAVWNAMPYPNLEARGIPMLDEREIDSSHIRLIAFGAGKSKSSQERVFNIAELGQSEMFPLEKAKIGSNFAIVPPTKDGEIRTFLFDFGKMVVGMPVLSVNGARGGEIIDINTSDYCSPEDFTTSEIWNKHNICIPAMSNRMICREGFQRHIFFHKLGFRYAYITVRGNSSELKISPSLIWSAYPLQKRGKFACSDSMANRIWETCAYGQAICCLDSFVDTPRREQAQWWGDARIQARNMLFLSGDDRLLKRGIRQIGAQRTPNGLTYGLAPTGNAHWCILPDYSLAWLLTIFDHWRQTASPEMYLEQRSAVLELVKYFESTKEADTGLLKSDPRYWTFLDWADVQKDGCPAILNHWYLAALDALASLCRDNSMSEDAAFFSERACTIRKSIEKNLISPDGLALDGVKSSNPKCGEPNVHDQILARINGIKNFNFDLAAERLILPYLRQNRTARKYPSIGWAMYVFEVMTDAGYGRDVYDYIIKNWAAMAEYGSTFEILNAKSGSHAWSAYPVFMLPRILCGIRQEAPGWKKVSYSPYRLVNSASAVFPTPLGDIKVSWKKNPDGTFSDEVSLPKGIELVKSSAETAKDKNKKCSNMAQ